ncbi:MAG: PepSY domain-containing protein [Bacillota bacterium]
MKNRILVYVVSGALVLGGAIGLGGLPARAASAKAAPAPAAQTATAAADQTQDQQGDQPSYTSSIQVPNPQDQTGDGTEGKDSAKNAEEQSGNEAAEAAALQAMAKLSPEQAKAAALAAVPGTVVEVDLDNENGNLVYSVEVKTADGVKELKIDAGNGQVLAQDSQNEDGDKGSKGEDNEKGSSGPDLDQVQEESGD